VSDQVPLVKGEIATIPEAKIARAIEKLGYDYWFQYWLWGGQTLRGGVVVDFVVQIPYSVPLEYDGLHWHQGDASVEDNFQRNRIAEYFGVAEVIVITSLEVDSDTPQDQVLAIVRAKLGGVF
jgi:hypothetical protein